MQKRARSSGEPRSSARAARSAKGGAAPAAADKQAQLGNAAMVQRAGTAGSTGVSNAEATAWLTESDADIAAGNRPKRGPSEAGGPMRAGSVRRGIKGALIGSGSSEIAVSPTESGADGEKVPDGTAAEVLEAKGDRIRVRVRVATKNVDGWVDAALFSDEPALTRDEMDRSLADDYVYSKFEGDNSPKSPTGRQTAQGFAGNCFLIASMAAVANASPSVIENMVKYNAEKGTYTVTFQEETGRGAYKPVPIEVDSYLPTKAGNRKDPVYAGDQGGPLWSAIIEKAYAKWKGGYDVIGEGGTGAVAMAEMTGARSTSKSPQSLKEDEVIPWFQAAKKDGKAIYAGVKDGKKSETQTPLSGSGDGPFTGKVSQTHRWNEIVPGSVAIHDARGKAPDVRDRGANGDITGKLVGSGASGTVGYKGDTASRLEVTFDKGRGPADGRDLQVDFEYEGVIDLDKFIIANHAYAFEDVVNGKELQFYNPWGTYQPKPITPAEFLALFDSLCVNTPPATKTQG